MTESIDGKFDGFLCQGNVDKVHYNQHQRFLRLELRYNEKDVEVDGCKGTSYVIKSVTYNGDEIAALLAQFSLPCPTQLLGRTVSIYGDSPKRCEITPA